MFDYFFYLCREHNNTTNKEIARIESRVFFFSLWERKRLFLLQKLHIKKEAVRNESGRESVKIVERERREREIEKDREVTTPFLRYVYTEDTRGTRRAYESEETRRNMVQI